MLEHCLVITFDFLFYLQSVNAFGETFYFCRAYCVNQTRLPDTVATDETVLGALGQTQSGVFDEMLASDDNS